MATLLTLFGALGAIIIWYILNLKYFRHDGASLQFWIFCLLYGLFAGLVISFMNDAFNCNKSSQLAFKIGMFSITIIISGYMYHKHRRV
jgi:hypothetical protein